MALNSTLAFPISGSTVPTLNITSTSLTYTARSGGNGAMVYLMYKHNSGTTTVNIAINSTTFLSHTLDQVGVYNLLTHALSGGYMPYPTDRNNNPYLLLAPNKQIVVSATGTGGNTGLITALEL